MRLQEASGGKQGQGGDKGEDSDPVSPGGTPGEEMERGAAGSSPSVTSMPNRQQLHSNEQSPEAVMPTPTQPSMLELGRYQYVAPAPTNSYQFRPGTLTSPMGHAVQAMPDGRHGHPHEAQAIASPVASATSPTHYAMSPLQGWTTAMTSPMHQRPQTHEQVDVAYLQRHGSTPSVMGSESGITRYSSMPVLQPTPGSPYAPSSSRHTPVAGQAPYALYHPSTTPTTPVDPVQTHMRYYPEHPHQQQQAQHGSSQY